MRRNLMIALAVGILALLNYSIYEKEQVIQHGKTVFLELAPVDPRSMMQGDYMRLRYALEREASKGKVPQDRGFLVVKPDVTQTAQFVRFHAGETLNDEELNLRYNARYRRVKIVPDTFFFQEGHREYYQEARYGVFKVDQSGGYVMVGLADETRKLITPALQTNDN